MEFLKKLFLLLVVAFGCAAPVGAMDRGKTPGDLALEKSRQLADELAYLLDDSDDDDMLSRDELLEALAAEEEREAAAEAERLKREEQLARQVEAKVEAERLKREAQLAREREKVEKEAAAQVFKRTAQELFEAAKQQAEEAIEMDQMDEARKVLQRARNHINNYREHFDQLPDDLRSLRREMYKLQDTLLQKTNKLFAKQQIEKKEREASAKAAIEKKLKEEAAAESERLEREAVVIREERRLAQLKKEREARAQAAIEKKLKEEAAAESERLEREAAQERLRKEERESAEWARNNPEAYAEIMGMFGGGESASSAPAEPSVGLSMGGVGFPVMDSVIAKSELAAASDDVFAMGEKSPKELYELALELSDANLLREHGREASLIDKIKGVLKAQPGLELQKFKLNRWGDEVTPMYKMSEMLSKESFMPLLEVMDLTEKHLKEISYRPKYYDLKAELDAMLSKKEEGRVEALVAVAQAGLADDAAALSGVVLNDGQLDFKGKTQQDFKSVERSSEKYGSRMSFIGGDLGGKKSAIDFYGDGASTSFHNKSIHAEQEFVPAYADLDVCGIQAMVSANAIVAQFFGQAPVMGPDLPLIHGDSFQEVWVNNQSELLSNFAELEASGKLTVSFLDHGQSVKEVANSIARQLQDQLQKYNELESYDKRDNKDLLNAAAVVFIKGRKETMHSFGMGVEETANDPMTEHWFAVILLQSENDRNYSIRTRYIIVDALGFYKRKIFGSGDSIYNQSRLKDSTVKELMREVETYLAVIRSYDY